MLHLGCGQEKGEGISVERHLEERHLKEGGISRREVSERGGLACRESSNEGQFLEKGQTFLAKLRLKLKTID